MKIHPPHFVCTPAHRQGLTVRVFPLILMGMIAAPPLLVTRETHAAPRAAAQSPREKQTPTPFVDGFSRKVDDVFNEALNALVEGRSDDFHALLSSSTIERETRGSGAVDKIIRERFIPYFSDFSRLTANAASMPTEDPEGHKGLALFRSFETEDHKEKPFVMYIVEEEGKLVVSNLLLNKRLVDVAP
jgi:hypothetical protein